MANRKPMSRIGVVEVSGPSMSPTLTTGDQVVVRYGAAVRPGHVVVLRHPFRQDLRGKDIGGVRSPDGVPVYLQQVEAAGGQGPVDG